MAEGGGKSFHSSGGLPKNEGVDQNGNYPLTQRGKRDGLTQYNQLTEGQPTGEAVVC